MLFKARCKSQMHKNQTNKQTKSPNYEYFKHKMERTENDIYMILCCLSMGFEALRGTAFCMLC